MEMRKTLAAVLLTAGLTMAWTAALEGLLVGQAAGAHRGLLIGGGNLASGVNWMLQLDAQNRPTTLRSQVGHPIAPWRTWGNLYGMTMDADNRTVIIPGIASPTLHPLILALVRYDPAASAVVGTLWQGPATTLTLTNWSNLTLNSDGDVITIDNGRASDAVAEFDVHAGAWRRTDLPVTWPWLGLGLGAGVGGCEWDAFRGGVHHVTMDGSSVAHGYLWHTSHDYRTTSSLSQVLFAGLSGFAVRFGGTLLENDDWISSAIGMANPSSFSAYFISSPRNGRWSWVNVGTGTTPLDVTHEKYAAPGRGVWSANWWPQEARYIDTVGLTTQTVYAGTPTTWPGNAYEILPLYNRDLGSRRTGKATWDLFVNPGGGLHAGRPYLIAASFTAPHRGLKLPDGRQVFLGMDGLALATAQGPIPPLLTGTHGTLNPTSGVGKARIDLTQLGRAFNGRVLHFCAVVLDPTAPSGMAWVCEPHAFVIDVLP